MSTQPDQERRRRIVVGVDGSGTSRAALRWAGSVTEQCVRHARCSVVVARRLGVEPLTPEEVGLGPAGWRLETPLWFYLLKEAEHRGGGERLGPVGGRLVGEVLVGIVDADGESYRAVDPGWRPTLPAAQAGRFGLADLLAFSAEVAEAAA
jgi:hypothetical protein